MIVNKDSPLFIQILSRKSKGQTVKNTFSAVYVNFNMYLEYRHCKSVQLHFSIASITLFYYKQLYLCKLHGQNEKYRQIEDGKDGSHLRIHIWIICQMDNK